MITVKQTNNKISIEGHAFYADYGNDIVCASVSSIVTTSINAIESIDKESINYNYKDEVMTINIIKQNDITKKLITNMLNLLKELEKKYKDNIKVI